MIKLLTPEQMREVDSLTIESGIPGLILMENAGCRAVEFLESRFAPLREQRIVVICGKGNNGGDGLVIARQLLIRHKPKSLDVFLAADPQELHGDAAANYRMFLAAGGRLAPKLETAMGAATIVIDALLGTGLKGPVTGEYLEWIRTMNTAFPGAKIVAVDIPSGFGFECVRAHHTVTFTAPKLAMILNPEAVGELVVGDIGSPAALLECSKIQMTTEADVTGLLQPRPRNSNKGMYGHVLVVGGAAGKTGAAHMAGLAALRSGAGWVTVASSDHNGFEPELMTEPLGLPLERKTVVAIGPGLGTAAEMVEMVRHAVRTIDLPMVIDADGLNAIAGLSNPWLSPVKPRILTPHPGEMSRLDPAASGDRIETARRFAVRHDCCVVLKGDRTVLAFPDEQVWINPTGSPAMSKAGAGDILTGIIAGLVAQYPNDWQRAVVAAVYLHGRAGERAGAVKGERGVLATDLLDYLGP